jgi:dynein heavy chain 2
LQLAELSEDLKQLPVNSLLAAAFITYLSFAPEDIRQSLMAEWQDLFGMKNFSFTTFLGSEKDQLQWLSEGLPSDQLSIQNAVIILQVKFFIVNMLQLSMSTTVVMVTQTITSYVTYFE